MLHVVCIKHIIVGLTQIQLDRGQNAFGPFVTFAKKQTKQKNFTRKNSEKRCFLKVSQGFLVMFL